MTRRHDRQLPAPPLSAFAGFRFQPEVIRLSVRWYLRFGLSYRDFEELLAERGIEAPGTRQAPAAADTGRRTRRYF